MLRNQLEIDRKTGENSPSPLLEGLGAGTDHQSMQQGASGEQSLVLQEADFDGDIVHSVSLLGGFTLNKSLGLKGTELVLHHGVLGVPTTKGGQCEQRLLLATCFVSR
jgi:hypothetical protein